ncbi:MAG: CCA tRNA nucleotidyltransferase [Alphaproteobacteria bacterium]|nr:CCA tRNA nucleotidyltransferase [Alphaproteobacteria bacterium]
MATVLSNEQKARLLTPDVKRLLAVLGDEARVVGGAVRDVLLGCVPVDLDMASSLEPEAVMSVLKDAGIKGVPTGIAHGTVTAVLNGKGYEITTLRRDKDTDGRHAHVEFTDDWQADAERRDFTMNALSVDASGILYDYVGGQADVAARHVRFIGDAAARIREDVLRILRYFRFQAFFGNDTPDAAALEACRVHARLVPTLSVERVAREMLTLLESKDPEPALQLMVQTGVLVQVLPEAKDFERLRALKKSERKHALKPSGLTRLSSLLPPTKEAAHAVAKRLKLSRADAERLEVLSELPLLLERSHSAQEVRRCLYAYGVSACTAAAALAGVEVFPLLAAWEAPEFPLRGKDLLSEGLAKGPALGNLLRVVEGWWIEGDFRADRDTCLAHAKELLDRNGKNP